MTNEMKFCSIDGCTRNVYARGYCRNHYKKLIEKPKLRIAKAKVGQEEQQHQVAKSQEQTAAKLSTEQLQKIFMTPCRTEQDLKNFIKYFFNLHLPDCRVSRYADATPFHAIWEVYDICVNKNNPNNIQDIMYLASRGSGKTLGMAIAELLILLHDQRDVAHVGAILTQAKRCYEYQQKFLLSDRIRPLVMPPKANENDRILMRSTMEKSTFNLPQGTVTIEVLPCTLRACLVNTTEALDINGNRKQISQFAKGDVIATGDGFVEVVDNSIDEASCLRIELDDGRIIEGTYDHKVWTNRGWIELQYLRNEDEVILF